MSICNRVNLIMKKTLLAALILTFAVANSYGFNYYYDNVFADGTSPFDENNNWAPYDYPWGIGHQPSPGTLGEGGETFDLEGLQVKEQGNYIYIALANSFGYTAHSTGWNQDYRLGDLFIGVDGNANAYAIDIFDIANTGTTSLFQVNNSWNEIQDVPGSYYNYASVRTAAGAHEIGQGATSLGSVDFALTGMRNYETNYLQPGNGDTYVWEFKLDKALLGNFTTLDFHVAVGCGNDWINKSYAAVPEPTTMILFGLGLAGMGITRRLRKKA